MRTELSKIEKIEKYIAGELSTSEKQEFDNELLINQELRNDVALQRQLIKRINYLSAKEELNLIHEKLYPTTAQPSILSNSYALLAGVIVLILSVALFLKITLSEENKELLIADKPTISHHPKEGNKETTAILPNNDNPNIDTESQENTPITKPTTMTQKSSPFRFTAAKVVDILYPNKEKKDKQSFTIQSNRDTSIVGKKGTKIFIPSKVFVRKDGSIVENSLVNIELIELYDLSDYIKYDLPTISNGKMLESGGVVYLNAMIDNEQLAIAKGKNLQIDFNSENAKKERMQAFYLERDKDEKPNWVTRQAPNKLAKKSTKQAPRRFAESNNVSASLDTKNQYFVFPKQTPKKLIAIPQQVLRYDLYYKGIALKDKPYAFKKISNILMDKQYANTYIATVAFRERLEGIFLGSMSRVINGEQKTEAEALLQIYLDNVSQPLWVADSIAVNQLISWTDKCEQFKNPRITLFRWLVSQNYVSVIVPEEDDKQLNGHHHYNKYFLAEQFSKKYNVVVGEWLKSYDFLKYKSAFRRYYKKFYYNYQDGIRSRFDKDYTYRLVLNAISEVGHWGFEYAIFYKNTSSLEPITLTGECQEMKQNYDKALENISASILNNSSSTRNNSLLINFLGWINCDRDFILPSSQRSELFISLQLQEDIIYAPSIYLIFKNLNSVLLVYSQSDNFSVNYLPIGEEVEVVALWHNGKQIFYKKEKLKLTNTNTLSMTLENTTNKEEVKNMLASIN
ncbi:MAG: hypothetical protein MUE81_02470 [Thermoflexibacter sp.]|nr:hypothetical protein [Thermoflexibacter sp.]